jgi:hypothetical protein
VLAIFSAARSFISDVLCQALRVQLAGLSTRINVGVLKAMEERASAILTSAGVGVRRMKSPKSVEIRPFASYRHLSTSIRID